MSGDSMTADHVEHEIGTFPGSPGRGGLESPVGHPSRIETIPAENVRRFSAAVVPRPRRPDWATFSPAFCGPSSSIFCGHGDARAFVPAAKALRELMKRGSR